MISHVVKPFLIFICKIQDLEIKKIENQKIIIFRTWIFIIKCKVVSSCSLYIKHKYPSSKKFKKILKVRFLEVYKFSFIKLRQLVSIKPFMKNSIE